MSAWPQIERCMVRQWAGLTAQQRREVEAAWTTKQPALASAVGAVAQITTSLWTVNRLVLLSVKTDWIPDTPTSFAFRV